MEEQDQKRELKLSGQFGYFERRRRLEALKKFYAQQDSLVNLYKEDEKMLLDTQDAEAAREAENKAYARKLKIDDYLAKIVLVMNLVILAGNLTASILSGSYAVISVFVDSFMDTLCSIIVQITIFAINHTNQFKYPRGRQRLELIAVLTSSLLMAVANVFMILQSAEAIIFNNVKPDANVPTLCILSCGVAIKVFVMVVCYKHGSINSSNLALDQRNDIITSVVALSCALIGDHFWKYADPVGAILVCTCVAFSWFKNALEQVPTFTGRRALHEHERRIQALAMKHDERIKCLDHISVYHIGEQCFVELHIVLEETMPLKETHDICETLQNKINTLDFVERTFVHVDYWCDGKHDGN
ncbi:Cation diffusion facilitator family transporter [Aphelenchoides bicaudatus]|nr:Cation diffusion facilitator family transporter [Aphelenchoides bicaudatus]